MKMVDLKVAMNVCFSQKLKEAEEKNVHLMDLMRMIMSNSILKIIVAHIKRMAVEDE